MISLLLLLLFLWTEGGNRALSMFHTLSLNDIISALGILDRTPLCIQGLELTILLWLLPVFWDCSCVPLLSPNPLLSTYLLCHHSTSPSLSIRSSPLEAQTSPAVVIPTVINQSGKKSYPKMLRKVCHCVPSNQLESHGYPCNKHNVPKTRTWYVPSCVPWSWDWAANASKAMNSEIVRQSPKEGSCTQKN